MFHTQIEFPYGEGRRSATQQDKRKDTAQAALTSSAFERAKLDAAYEESYLQPQRESQARAAQVLADCLDALPLAVRAELAQLAQLVDQRSAELSTAQRLYAEHTDDNDAARDSRSFKQRSADLLGAADAALAEVRAAQQQLKDAIDPHQDAVRGAYRAWNAARCDRGAAIRAEIARLQSEVIKDEIVSARIYGELSRLGWF